MKDIKMTTIEFVIDDSGKARERTEEVKNLIAQMLELANKRGRPTKDTNEVADAA